EISAGIHPARIQPQGVEVVRQVVVKLDLPRVAFDGMSPHRYKASYQFSKASYPRRLDRRAGQDGGSDMHEVTHRAFNVEFALDVILTETAHVSGCQVSEGSPVPDMEPDGGVRRANALPIGHGQVYGQGQRGQF